MYSLANQTLCVTGLIILCATTLSAQTAGPDLDPQLAKVSVLPRYNQWTLVDPDLRPALKSVTTLTAEQRDALAASENADHRGIAIFIADQQGDIAALLSYARLLEDDALTLPYALPTAGVDQYAGGPQTVGEYLSAAYLEWFGVDVDHSAKRFKRFKRYIGKVEDPTRLVKPWIVRLRRAAQDVKKTAELKKQIATLPDDVRWAVITLGYKDSVYTQAQARDLLTQLPQSTRQAIVRRENILPNEPLFKINRGALRRVLLDESQTLIE